MCNLIVSVALFLVDEQQQEWLKVLAKKHQVKAPTSLIVRDNADYVEQSNQWFDELLRHIDIIPASMALAQSANRIRVGYFSICSASKQLIWSMVL